MEALVQEVEGRSVQGKKVKRLRRAGITPANIYGRGVESLTVQVPTAEMEALLARAGHTHMITLKSPSFGGDRHVLVREVQRDAITRKLLHVDFYQVDLKEKIKVEVPLVLQADSPASRRKDLVVLELLSAIEVECLPTDIPEKIFVDTSKLAESGDRVLVKDLVVSDKVTILNHPDDVIAQVQYAKAAVIEEEVVKAPEEVEVATVKGKAEKAEEEEAAAEKGGKAAPAAEKSAKSAAPAEKEKGKAAEKEKK